MGEFSPELGMLPLQLSVVNNPVQAGEIFYRALFKASKWKTKLGGMDKPQIMSRLRVVLHPVSRWHLEITAIGVPWRPI